LLRRILSNVTGARGECLEEAGDRAERPAAVIISYKKVAGHPRITRIATTLAETGRDVLIVGLSDTPEETDFVVSPKVEGIGLAKFNFRQYLIRCALRPLNALQLAVDQLRWRT
jgi:methylmalonyl-CoA mutase cobalamin-binding subunit